MLYIGFHSEKHEKIFLSENHMVLSVDIWYVASPGEPLPSLFKLWLWTKNGRPWGHMLYFGIHVEKHETIFLSETIRPRVLIFGMYYPQVDLYQVCSNYAPGAKNGPTLGVTCFT